MIPVHEPVVVAQGPLREWRWPWWWPIAAAVAVSGVLISVCLVLTRRNHAKPRRLCDSVGGVFYINLADRTDRKEQITSELEKHGVDPSKVTRVDAVYDATNGHIGCAKSHIKALELAKSRGLKNVMILEDDFVFEIQGAEASRRWESFREKFGDSGWDAVHLAYANEKFDESHSLGVDGVKRLKRCTTSSAYVVNAGFYDALIAQYRGAVKKMEGGMEEHLQKHPGKKRTNDPNALDQGWHKLQEKSRWYAFETKWGKQGGKAGKSTIMDPKAVGAAGVVFPEKVCVVGNGSVSESQRVEINRCPYVIRFNDLKNFRESEKMDCHVVRRLENSKTYSGLNKTAKRRADLQDDIQTIAIGLDASNLPSNSKFVQLNNYTSHGSFNAFDLCDNTDSGNIPPAGSKECASVNKHGASGVSAGTLVLSLLEKDPKVETVGVYGMNWGFPSAHSKEESQVVRKYCTKCTVHETPTDGYRDL